MLDVTEQLRRYAEAAGDAVPERPVTHRSRRTWTLTAVVAGVVVLAGVVWLVEGWNDAEGSQVATGLAEHSLVVPASGASAQQLDDGTPVWVVRHGDSSVSVVDAVSTHRPYGAGQLVGWCETSRGFEDPMYGSLFDAHGRNRGGPAPVGLAAYPVTEIDGDTVTVTAPPRSPQRSSAGGPPAVPPAGEHCFGGGGGDVPGFNPGTVELHALSTETPVSLDDAMEQSDGTLVLVDAPVVIVDGQQPVVCQTDVTDGSPPHCDGVAAPGLGLPRDQTSAVLHGAFIARPDEGALTEIAYVAERTTAAVPIGNEGDARAEELIAGFLRLAEDPGPGAVARLPFTAEVKLGLGNNLHLIRHQSELADPNAWIIEVDDFRAYTGPFSALDLAASAEEIVVSVGEHAHCASPPMPPPDEVAHLQRVSVQPDLGPTESCLHWWTVDLYIDRAGRIEAVTLDLWEP